VWSLYVEMWVAPLLPLFYLLSRRRNARLDVVVLAALLALAGLTWGRVLAEYWFVFYLGMLVESHGQRWAGFLTGRLGVGGAIALTYAVMALPDMVLANRPPEVIVIEAFSAFTLISIVVRCGRSPRLRVLDHPVVRWNGRLSYSFYLWHLMILTVLTHALYSRASPAFMQGHEVPIAVGLFTASVAVALGIAQLSYRFVEKPGIALGHRIETWWLRRPRRGTGPLEMPAPVETA
jgi:peptidoglycan/LPS O-acetylase OafA/YrhL